jgi:predicted CDP-diglyceride synthetase/phosphatidate cytidylyltransferase
VDRNRLQPGSGQFLNTLKSFVYTAPVAFHFLRYTLDAF